MSALKNRLRARHNAEDLLIKELDFGTPTEYALSAIADKFQLPWIPGGAKRDLAAALARRILDFNMAAGPQRFQEILAAVDTMIATMSDSKDRVPRIVNLVAPFCWVAPAAAVRLAALSALPSGQIRAIAWKRSWGLSERMYLYRGYCTRSPAMIRIASASDVAGGDKQAILEHIHSVLAIEVCRRKAALPDLKLKITELTKQGVPVFLLLPADAVDAAILADVSGTFPEVCIFLFGEFLDITEVRDRFPGVELVDPALAEQDESEAQTGWGDCMVAAGIPSENLQSGTAF